MSSVIELLAPARDLETGRVAVDSGADAVYIGGPGFGARHAAGNSVRDIAALVSYARPFGVRVYAALNTLLVDSELGEAEKTARELIDSGIDAFIVQDMAYLRMGLGEVEFHASTQVSATTPDGVAFLGQAGFRRVILERSLSLDEIRAIGDKVKRSGTQLEAFIHGAICVGYSGRCFLSRSMGPRSGNRGDCSQPCRLTWDLIDEGTENTEGTKGRGTLVRGVHLLSVRDLDLSARVAELIDAGVSSLKIEGRLKDPGYVRNVVSHYRRIIDEVLKSLPSMRRTSIGRSEPDFRPDPAKSFSRGATEWFFDGTLTRNPVRAGAMQGVASPDTPGSVGEPMGTVDRVGCDRTGGRWFTLSGTGGGGVLSTGDSGGLSAGDGICFPGGGTNINRVEGGRIYPNKMEGIVPGIEIGRNYDHAFARSLHASRMRRKIDVRVAVGISPESVAATFIDETGLSVCVSRPGVFDEARDPMAMRGTVCEQFSKSGGTIFAVTEVDITVSDEDAACIAPVRFVPVSLLAELRREGLTALKERRGRLPPRRDPAIEDLSARFPRTRLGTSENVTNRLAERFYRDHGVTAIDPPLELRDNMSGETVIRSRHCIRREMGECLRLGTSVAGPLRLERGGDRYRLDFDCDKCEMSLIRI